MSQDASTTRRARPDDAPILAEAQRLIARVPGRLASRPHEIDEAAIRDTIVKVDAHGRGLFLLAEREGRVVGHGLLKAREVAVLAHVVELTLAVHEGHQGQGIGRMLMLELLAWARSNPEVEKVELQVRASNERAVRLYLSLGFAEEGRKSGASSSDRTSTSTTCTWRCGWPRRRFRCPCRDVVPQLTPNPLRNCRASFRQEVTRHDT